MKRACSEKAIAFFFVIGLFVAVILAGESREARAQPIAREGILDLASVDVLHSRTISLNGSWQYLSGRFVTPGREAMIPVGDWQEVTVPEPFFSFPEELTRSGLSGRMGYGTYRLRILLPVASGGADAESDLGATAYGEAKWGIKTNTIRSAFRLYADGELVFSTGRPGTTSELTEPSISSEAVQVFDHNQDGVLELLMHVSNNACASGGIVQPILFGRWKAILHSRVGMVILDAVVVTVYLLIFLFLLIKVLHQGVYDGMGGSSLILAIYMLLIALNMAVHSDKLLLLLFPSFPYAILQKLQFSTTLLIPQTLLIFMLKAYHRETPHYCTMKSVWTRTSFVITLMFLVAVLATRLHQFQIFLILFGVHASLLCLVSLYRIARGFFIAEPGFSYLTVGMLTSVGSCLGMLRVSWSGAQFWLLHATMTVMAISQILYYVRSDTEMRTTLKDKEEAWLNAQIRPHFLFNTLQTVMALCRIDPGKAEATLGDLSCYLRDKMQLQSERATRTIEEEIETVKTYVCG